MGILSFPSGDKKNYLYTLEDTRVVVHRVAAIGIDKNSNGGTPDQFALELCHHLAKVIVDLESRVKVLEGRE